MIDLVRPKSVWAHHSGNYYEVITLANMLSHNHTDYPPMVVYRRQADNTVWCRPLDKWHQSMTFEEQL